MKVIIENEVPVREKLESGDILVYRTGGVHIITENKVNGSDGSNGLNGISLNSSMWSSDPQTSLEKGEAYLYKKDEYELVLRKKS